MRCLLVKILKVIIKKIFNLFLATVLSDLSTVHAHISAFCD